MADSHTSFLQSSSGIPLESVYTPDRHDPQCLMERLGDPGRYPYTRGIYQGMYRDKLWTMRQYAGFSTAEESNQRYKYLLQAGQSGLSVAFDLPTQMGYDPDSEIAAGEVGRAGVSIASLKDVETLFAGIRLDEVSTSMTINSTAIVLLAMYQAVAEKQGITPEKLRGTIQNDMLKEYAARGTYRFPVQASLRMVTDVFEYCCRHCPRWHPISISGYHMREAGCDAVQEIAFTLGNGIAYVEAALARGMKVDDFAPQLSFFFACHNDFFEEVAKFRAARRLWARIMTKQFKAEREKSRMLRFHAQTGGSTLTAAQPENNVIRVTLQALAAVLGGTQSLHTNARDEALSLPTEESARIALRTQQIIAYESGVTRVVDPLGGCPYIEALTDQLEAGAQRYLTRIKESGGMIHAIENGYIQEEIHRSAYRYQKSVESGDQTVVGVNRFVQHDEARPEIFNLCMDIEDRRKSDLASLRKARDGDGVACSLKTLQRKANSSENLFPYVLECVKQYATIGEIFAALEGVFGRYHG